MVTMAHIEVKPLIERAKRRWVRRTSTDQEVGNSLEISLEDKRLMQAVVQAKDEWLSAHSYFNNATDPALVDHAILILEAAERKYMFLLNEAKGKGLVGDTF